MHSNRLSRSRHLLRSARSILLIVGVVLLLASCLQAEDNQPFFFMQLTDPQFGMYANNADFDREATNLELAVAAANRLKPAFVIVTGDLLNKPGDAAQATAYLQITAKLAPSIRLYHVPGNHDVGNDPTPESIAAYTARFGATHYHFRVGNLLGLVWDTTLLRASQGAPQAAAEQEAWLTKELEQVRPEGLRHIVIFQHHALFLKDAAEPDQYFNVPREARQRYLNLFHQAGVTHVFAGHYHGNQIAHDGALEMVTSAPLGKPLHKDPSGLRIVIVRDRGIEHQYYPLGDIPDRIELSASEKTPVQAGP